MKAKNNKGKEYPKSLNYFNISAFPELIAAYGEKPDKLVLMFPSDQIEEFFLTEYSLWGSKGTTAIKKRCCDGEECQHLVAEKAGDQEYAAGEISPCLCLNGGDIPQEQKCKSYTCLKAFVLHPQNGKIISPMCYQFETHSDNSSDAIYTELDKIWHLTGGHLAKIPFVVSVQMVEKVVPVNGQSEKRKFPIWALQAWGTTDMILDFANRATLPTTDKTAIMVETKALTDGIQPTFNSNKEFAEELATGESPPGQPPKEPVTDHEIRQRMGTLILEMAAGGEKLAHNLTLLCSTFHDKEDGSMIIGKVNLEDLNDKWLKSAYGKTKLRYEDWKKDKQEFWDRTTPELKKLAGLLR